MTVKYYGRCFEYLPHNCILFWRIDPYANLQNLSPSYCVWIVPGTLDADGNPLEA